MYGSLIFCKSALKTKKRLLLGMNKHSPLHRAEFSPYSHVKALGQSTSTSSLTWGEPHVSWMLSRSPGYFLSSCWLIGGSKRRRVYAAWKVRGVGVWECLLQAWSVLDRCGSGLIYRDNAKSIDWSARTGMEKLQCC